MDFDFLTDGRSRIFCETIAREMCVRFGVSKEEALGRINRAWAGQSIVGDDIVYHEDEVFWACDIYYGHDSLWWKPGEKPEPLPYP
jgi:hypothetical protein